MRTNEEVAKWVCRGTTTRPDKLIVLYNDGTTVLVKQPGGYDGGGWCRSYISSWVDKYDITEMDKRSGLNTEHTNVWDCDRDKDGRLTRKRLGELVDKLGLDKEYICEYSRQSNQKVDRGTRQQSSAASATPSRRKGQQDGETDWRDRSRVGRTRVERLTNDLTRIKEALEQAIWNEMDAVARAAGLTEMVFTHMGNSYRRGKREVSNKRLDELDDLYCEEIHSGGFEAPWSSEKGWH